MLRPGSARFQYVFLNENILRNVDIFKLKSHRANLDSKRNKVLHFLLHFLFTLDEHPMIEAALASVTSPSHIRYRPAR